MAEVEPYIDRTGEGRVSAGLRVWTFRLVLVSVHLVLAWMITKTSKQGRSTGIVTRGDLSEPPCSVTAS